MLLPLKEIFLDLMYGAGFITLLTALGILATIILGVLLGRIKAPVWVQATLWSAIFSALAFGLGYSLRH